MSGKRQKTQYSLASRPMDRGETPVSGQQRAEPLAVKPAPESPAETEHLMEEVCDRENLQSAWKRVRRNQGSPGVDGMTIDDAKGDARHAELSDPAIRLGHFDPLNRLWLVGSIEPSRPYAWPVLTQVVRRSTDSASLAAGSARAVGPNVL